MILGARIWNSGGKVFSMIKLVAYAQQSGNHFEKMHLWSSLLRVLLVMSSIVKRKIRKKACFEQYLTSTHVGLLNKNRMAHSKI